MPLFLCVTADVENTQKIYYATYGIICIMYIIYTYYYRYLQYDI